MSKRERQKGQRGERELAGILSDQLGRIVQRRLGQERDSGCDMLVTLGGPRQLAVEVKRQERAQIHGWLEQATAGAGEDMAAVAWRPSRRGWVVAMDLGDWLHLVREAIR